ncbi:hypothetical protein TIFTF001_054674 [Ficus carica]|uniref:Uncharacterized protein n=1 Tax=Ficus carica TaxID=3494 RepID=A0AA88EDP2_FICCA|nr:hypothetical protein TIFTF001_054674 [Ficus carica]
MPEGYEVGLIDIELVTKENSPGIENHDSLGRFTGRIAFGSIKPSKDQSFRINRDTMMEDNNAQGAGGGGTPLPLL